MSPPDSAGPGQHIVDVLIAERAPRLASSPAWPLVRPLLYRLLNYRRARQMADAVAQMGGHEALDYVSRLLEVKVEVRGLERIPEAGRLVIVANHPTGIADGVAAWDALGGLEPLFARNYNDVDLCLRAAEAGFTTMVTPHACLVHNESATRGIAWDPKLAAEGVLFRARWRRT